MNQTINWVITIILIFVAGYTFFVGTKSFNTYKKEAAVFKETHPEAVEYNFAKWQFPAMLAFGFVGLAFAVILPRLTSDLSEAWNTRILYVALALLLFGMAFDSFASKHIILGESSFFYEGEVQRYKLITKIEPSTGRFKPCIITFGNQKQLTVSKALGDQLIEAYNTWKENKKNSRKKGRNRRQSA